jgi:peptidyl-prolyl cis-trans isomerase C
MKLKLAVALSLFASSLVAQTVVSVNGTDVDEKELFPIIQKITRGQYANLPADKKQMAQKIALEQAIATVLLKDEAAKSGVKNSPEYKKAFVEYVKNIVEPNLVYQIWIEKEMNKMKVSDKDTKEYYEKNKERLHEPKRSHVHHLLLKTEKEANDQIAIINRAKDKKAKFLEVASKIMGTPETGVSDLGELDAKSQMAPAFKAAYTKMSANSLSKKAVKTQFGFHVIYVDTVTGGERKSYKELKDGITQALKAEKFDLVLKEKVEALHKKAKIEFK